MAAMSKFRPLPAPPPHVRRRQRLQIAVVATLAALVALNLATFDFPPWSRIQLGISRNVPPLARGFFNPSVETFGLALRSMLETFHIAVIGTAIGGLLAFPLSFLAAGNLLGGSRRAFPGKMLLVGVRTFPEILLAIVFVAALGPGSLAGVMAIGIHSIGFLGKIFADVIEGIDPGPNEAVYAAGGTPLHVFLYSVVPQVLPEFLSNVLYRFEINMRAATVLGLVGAGGIGLPLIQRLQFRRWDEVSTLLIVIVVTIIAVDALSSRIRRRLV